MAKAKSKVKLKECGECRYGFNAQGQLYCELRLQDTKVLKSSGIVSRQECGYFSKGLIK
jgi:hypothetical protein